MEDLISRDFKSNAFTGRIPSYDEYGEREREMGTVDDVHLLLNRQVFGKGERKQAFENLIAVAHENQRI